MLGWGKNLLCDAETGIIVLLNNFLLFSLQTGHIWCAGVFATIWCAWTCLPARCHCISTLAVKSLRTCDGFIVIQKTVYSVEWCLLCLTYFQNPFCTECPLTSCHYSAHYLAVNCSLFSTLWMCAALLYCWFVLKINVFILTVLVLMPWK